MGILNSRKALCVSGNYRIKLIAHTVCSQLTAFLDVEDVFRADPAASAAMFGVGHATSHG